MSASRTEASVLADRLFAGQGVLRDLARIAASNLLLVLCAWIALPLPRSPVPLTGQTLGLMLISALLGSRRAAIVVGLYLLEGLAGLPVFQPFGLPGVARLVGPTAGYLLAFPAAAFLIGWLAERRAATPNQREGGATLWLAAALLAGELVTFAGGCAWLATGMGLGWSRALVAGALPFLPGELVKVALVVAAVRGLELASRRT